MAVLLVAGVFVAGAAVGFIAGIVLSERFRDETELACRIKVSRAESKTNLQFLENEELRKAIATAQQALAEVRPPRTEHKVNY